MQSLFAGDQPATVLVAGGSRGIGRALVEALLQRQDIGRIYVLARHWSEPAGDPREQRLCVDLTDPQVLHGLGEQLRAECLRLDLLINCVGLLHEPDGLQPEKRLADVQLDWLLQSFTVNAAVPLLLARELLPLLRGRHLCRFASLSARVGSIGDNRLGGWYAYRAAKAAQNMLLRTFAIEWARLNPNGCCLLLHPGTTDTGLSAPFQANVPEGRLFAPAFVAERLLQVIAGHGPADSGNFYAWDGQPIPW